MPQKPVDRPIVMVVGPLLDDSTGKVPQTSVAWNAAGMGIDLIVEKHDGTSGAEDVTPASSADWTHLARGYYAVAISAGDNEDTGTNRLAGFVTGSRPFRSPDYDMIRMHEFDARVSGTTNARIVADTTMTNRSSQTVFRLTAGSSVDDFYVGHSCILYDVSDDYAASLGTVTGYVGSTKQVTLASAPGFTTVNGDVIIIEAVPLSVTVTSPHARAEMDDSSTKLAAIVADTNELQTDWTNGGRLDLIIDNSYALLSTIDGVTDITNDTVSGHTTDLASIESKTDGIASVTNRIETDTDSIDTRTTGMAILATVTNTAAAAIQVQTDKLPTTLTMQVVYDDLITIGTVAASPTPTTTAFAITISPVETTNDHFKDLVVGFADGPLKGQNAQVLSYDGSTKVLTVTEMTNAPGVGNVILLLGLVK